jgi:hypothetical protein
MSEKLNRLYGKNDVKALFGDSPKTVTPFPMAGGRKDVHDVEHDKVKEVMLHPEKHQMVDFDPRTLTATQPEVTRAGVSHYMSGSKELYADKGNAGNQRSMVYSRTANNRTQHLILSGTHRATTALLQGEQFKAVHIEGGYGPAR